MIIDKSLLLTKPKHYTESTENFNIFEYSLATLVESNHTVIQALQNDSVITIKEAETWGDKITKKFNFKGIIAAIIKAFLDTIQKIVDKIIDIFIELSSKGAAFYILLKTNKKKIEQGLKDNAQFNFDHVFKFTHLFDDMFPSASIKDVFSSSVNRRISMAETALKEGDRKAIEKLTSLNEDFDINKLKNTFRYRLLDTPEGDTMSDSSYSDRCFRLYRDGLSSEPASITLTGLYIRENIYNPYFKYKDIKNRIKKEQALVEKEAKNAKAEADKFSPNISKFSNESQKEILKQLSIFQRNICTMVNEYCHDVVIMYGAKLQAYKDNHQQSKKILTDVIKQLKWE